MSEETALPPLDPGPLPAVDALPPGREFSSEKPPSTAPRFFAALGNPHRWQMVKMLADGRALSASDVAAAHFSTGFIEDAHKFIVI